ncbi:DUF4190 domain-containing protein [Intrasporangium sp. YIM S08009]|uniref:DUF4190 domain-containing protein n=1 Tax=Intrasporangium zincisolvens TaxID=3080018 RepID=UPI002B060F6F|nr:DUF4190 domain-containing protein [Intrasporangium sp. YIM S08009]
MSDTQIPQSAPTQPGLAAPPPVNGSNGLATAGFVLGLLGLLASWIPVLNIVGLILGVLGAILAAVGLAKSKKVGTGKGLALTGLILGVLAVIIAIVVNVAFVNAVDDAVKTTVDTSVRAPADSNGAAAADKELGSSREKPAPIGSAITGGDWTVTINSVKTADKDSFGQKPAAGKKLLVVNLTATYNGDDAQGSSAFAVVKFVTAQGNTIDSTSGSTMFVPKDQFASLTKVFKGASVTGNDMLEVPANGWENGVLSVSPDMLSDDTFVAVK